MYLLLLPCACKYLAFANLRTQFFFDSTILFHNFVTPRVTFSLCSTILLLSLVFFLFALFIKSFFVWFFYDSCYFVFYLFISHHTVYLCNSKGRRYIAVTFLAHKYWIFGFFIIAINSNVIKASTVKRTTVTMTKTDQKKYK